MVEMFFFRQNLRHWEGSDQMSAFWSMFWCTPFRNFLRKFTIFRNFDQWSEILSMSDGRPSSQGVCPSLLTITHPNTRNEINLCKRMRRMKLSALEECIGETANNIKLKKKILILNLLPGEHAWNDTRSISRYCHFKTMSFSAKKSLQSN
jgi:hypothetical protein